MSHSPMFGTFTVAVDASNDLSRDPNTLQQRHDSRYIVPPASDDIMSGFTDDNFHHLPAPSARLPFPPSLDISESTISPTFSNFSPSTSSSYSIPSPVSAVVNTPSDPDDAWNLIPYNVSWGHEYEQYRAGILPGPEGDCVFLRSPTPLRNQRASEACKKCRERKAKCTGTRPSCARCSSRDYICEYASEATSDSAPPNATSTTAKSRRPSRRETREEIAILTHHHKGSSPPSPGQPGSNHCTVIKSEIPEFLSLHHYPDHTSSYWEGSTPSDDCSMEEPWQFHHHDGLLPDATNRQNALAGQRPLSIAAPHPVLGVPHRPHPVPPPLGVVVPVPPPVHTGDSQATAAPHAEILLPMLPHFDVPSQRLAEYEVYMRPEVKYEQCTAFSPSPHPYESATTTPPTVYHHAGAAEQEYMISMQPLQHADFDASGFPMHVPAPKLAFNGFAAPPYINYLPSP